MATDFLLPVLGENVPGGTVAKILVVPGQAVARDQTVLEVETEKAVIEVPAPAAGLVREVFVKQGARVAVGQKIFSFDPSGAAPAAPAKAAAPAQAKASPAPAPAPAPARAPEKQPAPAEPPPVEQGSAAAVAAAPSVRKFAREIGVDLSRVKPSDGGRISLEDVKAHARARAAAPAPQDAGHPSAAPAQAPAGPPPDFSRWGHVEARPASAIRQAIARQMTRAWSVPMVTQFDKADVTDIEAQRKTLSPRVEQAGGKLTMTAILVKACAAALRVFPQFNASFDPAGQQVFFKQYYNVGVAVDTDRGLLVPVLREADRKNLTQICVELKELAQKARDRKVSPDDLQGGTFTITNLGGIGGTGFTPVLNPPEAAILGVSRAALEPVFLDGQFAPRLMLPLALTYDHRLIDGADAARFLRWIVQALEQPLTLTLEG